MKEVNASEFKTKCFALLDWVKDSGEVLVILKHGKPVAEVRPAVSSALDAYPQQRLKGSFQIHGDVVEPCVAPEELSFDRENLE